jgi:hypothetical protein
VISSLVQARLWIEADQPGESRSLAAGNLIVIMGGQGWLAGQLFGMF